MRTVQWVSICFCPPNYIYSVLWEPMGDGKRLISLADNHALLWDLQESSTQATVRQTHKHTHANTQNRHVTITDGKEQDQWKGCLIGKTV